jgi:excisionase family DNA binding protein
MNKVNLTNEVNLVSIAEAQARIKLGKTYIYKLLAEQAIPAVKIGKRTFIRSDDLDEFINNLEPFKSRKIGDYYLETKSSSKEEA